jgi:hypothetical protein
MPVVTKFEAATRHLNAAIRFLFEGEDSLVVHSLAASAANVFSDLVENRDSQKSWRQLMREDHGFSSAELRHVLHRSWNFFKHADRDPNETLDFNADETEHLIFYATVECGEYGVTSTEMQLFQLWFIASGRLHLAEAEDLHLAVDQLFPGLEEMSREAQFREGAKALRMRIEGLR